MTISTEPAPLSYNGDGAIVNFAITWKYFAKSHVVATLRSTTGTETVWALTTNYTLTAAGVDAGGTLTAVTAPATGEKLVITLEPPNTQESSLPLGGPFPSLNVEDALDLSAQRDSKFKNLINRTFRVPVTDTQSGSSLEFPIDSVRASKFMAFNASGVPIASSGSAGTPASTFMGTVLDDTSAAAAAATLLVLPLAGGTMTGDITMSGAALNEARSNITQHATTMDFWAAAVGNVLDGTGSAVTITAIANAPQAGASRDFYPIVATILTHGATFDIDGAVNRTAAAGEVWTFVAKSVSTYRVFVRKADGTAVVGGFVLLQTTVASASASITMGSAALLSSTYKKYMIVGSNIKPATDNVDGNVRISIATAVKSDAFYDWTRVFMYSGSVTVSGVVGTVGTFFDKMFGQSCGNAAAESTSFILYIDDPAATDSNKLIECTCIAVDLTPNTQQNRVGGRYTNSVAAVDGIQFYFSSGNITSGTFKLYGIT